MYAIIETGGKQYKVSEGDIITVEKLGVEAGSEYTFENVLAVNNGEKLTVGTPVVAGASVVASVIGDGKAKKVTVFTYKPKKSSKRKMGHRQPYTKVEITAVGTAAEEKPAKKAAAPKAEGEKKPAAKKAAAPKAEGEKKPAAKKAAAPKAEGEKMTTAKKAAAPKAEGEKKPATRKTAAKKTEEKGEV